jgi:arsenate reductase
MNIQIFGARKSFDTKKAERWFKERRIKYQYIDLDSKGLSPGEYRSIRAAVGYDALVDRDSPDYRELGIDYLLPQAAEEELLENPWLFRAPIVRNGRQATVGYCPDVWKTWE